jgi:hypothetical protein
MTTYRIEPQQIGNAQDWIEADYPNIAAAAADLRRTFPTRIASEAVAITEAGVGVNGLDATPERHGMFRLGDGGRIA